MISVIALLYALGFVQTYLMMLIVKDHPKSEAFIKERLHGEIERVWIAALWPAMALMLFYLVMFDAKK